VETKNKMSTVAKTAITLGSIAGTAAGIVAIGGSGSSSEDEWIFTGTWNIHGTHVYDGSYVTGTAIFHENGDYDNFIDMFEPDGSFVYSLNQQGIWELTNSQLTLTLGVENVFRGTVNHGTSSFTLTQDSGNWRDTYSR